jgi:hypothetical protein
VKYFLLIVLLLTLASGLTCFLLLARGSGSVSGTDTAVSVATASAAAASTTLNSSAGIASSSSASGNNTGDSFHFSTYAESLMQLVVVMTGGLDYDSLDAVRSHNGEPDALKLQLCCTRAAKCTSDNDAGPTHTAGPVASSLALVLLLLHALLIIIVLVNVLVAVVSDSYKEIKRHEEQEMLRHYASLIVQTVRRRKLLKHCTPAWVHQVTVPLERHLSSVLSGVLHGLAKPSGWAACAANDLVSLISLTKSLVKLLPRWFRGMLGALSSSQGDTEDKYFHILEPIAMDGTGQPTKVHRQQRKLARDKLRDGWMQGSHETVHEVRCELQAVTGRMEEMRKEMDQMRSDIGLLVEKLVGRRADRG